MIRFFKILLATALLWCGLHNIAAAQDQILKKTFYIDPSGKLELDHVLSKQFNAFSGILSLGYGIGAVWVRLNIAETPSLSFHEDFGRDLVLRIRPAYLDEITVYDPSSGNIPQKTGDKIPASREAYRSLNLNALIKNGPERDVYIRLETSSTRLLSLELLPLQSAMHEDRNQLLIYAAYLGFLIATLFGALIYASTARDRVSISFCIKQAVEIIWTLFTTGIVRSIPVDWPWGILDITTSIVIIFYTTVSILFLRILLEEYRPQLWSRFSLSLLIAIGPINIGLIVFGFASLALWLNMNIGLSATILIFVSAIVTTPDPAKQPPVGKSTFVLIYGINFVLFGASMLMHLGFRNEGSIFLELGLNSLYIHGVLSTFLMSVFLYIRARMQSITSAKLETSLALAQQRIAHERQQLENNEHLLAMLAHELRTPLSVIKMLAGTKNPDRIAIGGAADEANSIIERLVSAGELERSRIVVNITEFDLHDHITQICERFLERSRIELSFERACLIEADKQLLGVAVSNLIDNAIKYSKQGTKVWISIGSDPADICMLIKNEVLEGDDVVPSQVFEKLYRSRFARMKSGSGLGLYIVHGLVNNILDGTISFSIADGIATAELHFPQKRLKADT